jgi:hypothetical protein
MRLVRVSALLMMDDFDNTLKARWLPKRYRNGVARDQLWKALETHMSGTAVAIVGIAGKHSHWTCTVRPTVKRHQIFGMYVIVIERAA